MTIGEVLITVIWLPATPLASRSMIVSWPQLVAWVAVGPTEHSSEGPPPEVNGGPARYIVEPRTNATLPAQLCVFELGRGTQAGRDWIRVFETRLYCCTLACIPPHSAPQLTM